MAYAPATGYGTTDFRSAYDPVGQACIDKNYAKDQIEADKQQEKNRSTGIASGCGGTLKLPEISYVQTAYDILEDVAKRGLTQPHKLPEAEIQILAAFILGCNSK